MDASNRSESTGVRSPARAYVQRWDPLIGRACRVLITSLVLFEIAARVIDWKAGRAASFYLPPSNAKSIVEPHPYLGFVQVPGWDRNGGYQTHINSLGMRGKEIAVKKPAGVQRILCAGGSTTFCTGATKDEKTWPGQLEVLLNLTAPPGITYEVGNLGVSGWASVESLIDLELRRVDLAPDYFIWYGATNDARAIQAVRNTKFEPDYTHLRRAWPNDVLSPVEEFLLGHVRTYARLSRGIDPANQIGALANQLYVPDYDNLHVRSDEGVNESGIATYVRNVRSMVWVCRAYGIRPILCTFAECLRKVEPDPQRERLVETVVAMNDALVHLADEEHVTLIDVAHELSDDPSLYDDAVHQNDAGCRAFAAVLATRGRAMGLFGTN